MEPPSSLPDDLHQHPFAPHPIEFAVENLLPRSEVEFAAGDGNYDFSSHYRSFQVGVGVVLVAVVAVVRVRFFRGQPFEPYLEVVMEPRLVVVDEDAGSDVHGVAEKEPFTDAAFPEALGDGGGDVDQLAALLDVEP